MEADFGSREHTRGPNLIASYGSMTESIKSTVYRRGFRNPEDNTKKAYYSIIF